MIKLRKLKASEVCEFAEFTNGLTYCHQKLNRAYFAMKPNATKIFASFVRKHVRDSKYLFMLAWDGKKMIGYIMAEIATRPPIFVIDKVGEIDDVYVLPEYEGHGIGKLLTEKAWQFFKKHRVKLVELLVYSKNKKAIKFYSKLGFKENWKRLAKSIKAKGA